MKPMPPPEVIEIVPEHIACDYQVLSVEARLPTRDQRGELRLLCLRVLTNREKESLGFVFGRSFQIVFVEPGHPEYAEYAEIVRSFPQILERYPQEEDVGFTLGADA